MSCSVASEPPIVRSVVTKRDFVYMEMTGVAFLPDLGERVGCHLAATLTSMWRGVDCANVKKLAWLMSRSLKLSAGAGRRKGEKDETVSIWRTRAGGCVACKKTPTVLGGTARDARKRKCHVCWQCVCASCKIKKKLSHINPQAGKLTRCELPFCSACVFNAVTTSSCVIAQQEIGAATAGTGNELSVMNTVAGVWRLLSSAAMRWFEV